MRADTQAGSFSLIVDEPVSAGGADAGPAPTDLLLASVASCFTLAMAYAARKRDLELPGLAVVAVGSYDGPRFARISVSVTADVAPDVLEQLIAPAERVCYVTNTLRNPPEISIGLG
jgi:uncharacterized OsmC-like protein